MEMEVDSQSYEKPAAVASCEETKIQALQSVVYSNETPSTSDAFNTRPIDKPIINLDDNSVKKIEIEISQDPSSNHVFGDNKEEEQSEKKPLYAEVKGPSFYYVKGNLVTPPVICKNLPDQFRSLPIYGRPERRSELPEFFHNKIREFVGYDLNDEEFAKLSKYCR
jgi:hypothetical protein